MPDCGDWDGWQDSYYDGPGGEIGYALAGDRLTADGVFGLEEVHENKGYTFFESAESMASYERKVDSEDDRRFRLQCLELGHNPALLDT